MSKSDELEDRVDELESEYRYRNFPWISKSKLKAYDFCEYNFYLNYFAEGVEKRVGLKAKIGQNVHMIFPLFFKNFDVDKAFRLSSPSIDSRKHPFKKYVYDTCMEFLPEADRNLTSMRIIFYNFAQIETNHWLHLNNAVELSQTEIVRQFLPSHNEMFLQNEDIYIYGTLDRVSWMGDNKGRTVPYIFDYKSGNVPTSIKRELKDTNNPYSWELPTKFSVELHFYILLYLLYNKCEISQDLIDFLTKPEFLTVKENNDEWKKLRKSKSDYLKTIDTRIYYPDGDIVKNGDVCFGVMFLGDKGGSYTPIKKFKYVSLMGVLRRINTVRSVWLNKKFVTKPIYNEYICPNCSWKDYCTSQIDRVFGV